MSLLFVSGEYPPDLGGVGDYTRRLREALSARGWPSGILSRRDVGRWNALSLAALLRVTAPADLVHIQFQAGAFDLLGDVCLMPTLVHWSRRRARVITTFHDVRVPYLFPRAGKLRAAAVRLLARTSDAVIVADERDLVVLGGPSPKHHQVPIGSNVPCAPPAGYDRLLYRSRLGLAPATLAVAYFGLLNASKGLDLLLDAFALAAGAHTDARLLLLGGQLGASDPTDRLTAARVRDRLSERVIVSGWLAPADLSAWLLASDLAVLPYADGASPRRGSLLACAEHGLPIVSTSPVSGQVADAVHAVDSSPDALATAILQVARDTVLSERLRAGSRALAARTAWPRIADAHIALYEHLLGSRVTSP